MRVLSWAVAVFLALFLSGAARAQILGDGERRENGVNQGQVVVKISPTPKAGRVTCEEVYDSNGGTDEFWVPLWSTVRCQAHPAKGWKVRGWNWREAEMSHRDHVRFQLLHAGTLEVIFER